MPRYLTDIMLPLFLCFCGCPANKAVSPSSSAFNVATALVPIPFHRLEEEKDIDTLIKAVGNAKVLLLKKHLSISEYYTWRTAITKRLVQEKDLKSWHWKQTGLIPTG
jgi:hypothetical protein